MVVSEITLFNVLKSKFGEQEAQTVVEGFKELTKQEFENNREIFTTKKDMVELRLEIEKLRTEMQSIKAETLRWMFIFWVGQIGALIAILTIFFK